MVERDRNRRKLLPSVGIDQEFRPGGLGVDDLPDRTTGNDDERLIDDFRQLVRHRLGDLGIAVLDARLRGEETKSLVGAKTLDRLGGSLLSGWCRRSRPWRELLPSGVVILHSYETSSGRWRGRMPRSGGGWRRHGSGFPRCKARPLIPPILRFDATAH